MKNFSVAGVFLPGPGFRSGPAPLQSPRHRRLSRPLDATSPHVRGGATHVSAADSPLSGESGRSRRRRTGGAWPAGLGFAFSQPARSFTESMEVDEMTTSIRSVRGRFSVLMVVPFRSRSSCPRRRMRRTRQCKVASGSARRSEETAVSSRPRRATRLSRLGVRQRTLCTKTITIRSSA